MCLFVYVCVCVWRDLHIKTGEAAEEEQQQVDLRGVQREAIRAEGLRPGLHGQGRSQIRPEFQHVSRPIIRSSNTGPANLRFPKPSTQEQDRQKKWLERVCRRRWWWSSGSILPYRRTRCLIKFLKERLFSFSKPYHDSWRWFGMSRGGWARAQARARDRDTDAKGTVNGEGLLVRISKTFQATFPKEKWCQKASKHP